MTWASGGGTAALHSSGRTVLGFSQNSSDSYVTVPASPSLNSLTDGSNTQLTLAAWVYPTADNDNNGILFKGPLGKGPQDGSQGTFQVSFAHGVGHPNELNFRLNGAAAWPPAPRPGEVTSNDRIPNNQWTFITCTYDGRQQRIYINGKLSASADYSAPLQNDASDLFIGTYCHSTSTYIGHYLSFQGHIDEVGIWKRALDAKTISALYNNGRGGGAPGTPGPVLRVGGSPAQAPWNKDLIAGYHLDEGRGTTVADFSGHGNTGTLHGGATWVRGDMAAPQDLALQFDGTGYVRIPGGNFRNLQSGTVSVWIRPTAGGYVLSSLTDTSNNRQGGVSLDDNRDGTFSVGVGEVSKDNRYVFSVRADNHFSHNAWHHVVYTSEHGSGTCRLYVDGMLQPMHFWQAGKAVDFFFADLMQSGDDLQVGATSDEHHVHCGFFKGAMRDLMIFDQAFSRSRLPHSKRSGRGATLCRSGDDWMGSLVAGYDFDEGRGMTVGDFSGHGNDGTLHGGVTWRPGSAAVVQTPAASVPNGLEFDGTGYVSIPGDSFRSLQSGTLSVWIRPTASGGDPRKSGIVLSSLHDMSNDRQFYPSVLEKGDGTFSVAVVGVTKDDRFKTCMETDNHFSMDSWHNLIYTSLHGSGKYDLYIDGRPQRMHIFDFGSVTDFFYADLMHRGDDLQIGAKSDSHAAHSGFFHGAMRELMVFDRVLSQDQVAALHAAGPGGDLSQSGTMYPWSWMRSLVAGYHFDEVRGTTVRDFSGHGNDGTLHGGVTWANTPDAGILTALHFDGQATSYVEIPNLDMERLTFATWVKRDVITKRQFMIKCARHGGWGVYFSEEIDIPGNFTDYLWFTHHGAGGWHSDAKIADTQWHFVAVTLDQHVLNFYIDGKPSGRDSMPYTIDSGGGGYFLGGTPNDRDCSLQGCLAETLVFNRPLGPAEIAELYNQTRGAERVGKMEGLVAGYHFDEGHGTTVADFSGHGNDGTLHGGVERVSGAAGPHARAMQFDGTRYATLPQSTKFTSGDFTLSLWFNPATADRSQYLFMRGHAYHDRPGDIGLRIEPRSRKLMMMARTADSRWLFDWTAPGPFLQGLFNLNQWNHVVVTRRGDAFAMWINGVRVSSQAAPGDISDTNDNSPFLLGGYMTDSGVVEKLQGALDEFRVFHRCLSDAEIAALYHDSNGGGESLLGSPAVAETAPPAPAFAKALHLDHGHVDLGGKQLTTGATSVSVWYQYDGHTDQFPVLLDLKAGPLSAMFVALNTTGLPGGASQRVRGDPAPILSRFPPDTMGDPGGGRQTVTFAHRGGDGRANGFKTTPFTPTAWTHLVCTYDGSDPYDVRSYSVYVNGRSLGLSPTVQSQRGPVRRRHEAEQPGIRLLLIRSWRYAQVLHRLARASCWFTTRPSRQATSGGPLWRQAADIRRRVAVSGTMYPWSAAISSPPTTSTRAGERRSTISRATATTARSAAACRGGPRAPGTPGRRQPPGRVPPSSSA